MYKHIKITLFLLKSQRCVIKVIKVLDRFLIMSGLKPNRSKCKIAEIDEWNGLLWHSIRFQCTDMIEVLKGFGRLLGKYLA